MSEVGRIEPNLEIIFTEGDASSGDQSIAEAIDQKTVYDPRHDTTAGIVLGLQAIMGTTWWILDCFLYIKNQATDDDLRLIQNGSAATVPIVWWWERITEQNGPYGWHAAALMTTFFSFFIVSVVEMTAWFCYIDGYYPFARWYFATIGYWMSMFTYIIPFCFELVHLARKGAVAFPGTWAIFHLLGSLFFWLFSGLSHLLYIDDFIAFIDAREPSNCECQAPEVLEMSPDADEETQLAWQIAIEQRQIMCDIECPLLAIAKQCQLKRLPDQSDEDYTDACLAVIERLDQNERAELAALDEEMAAEDEMAEEEEGLESVDDELDDESLEEPNDEEGQW